MNRFTGKVALVTGGRSGIGKAIARRLTEEGARVITAQRGKDDSFESISADFCEAGGVSSVIDGVLSKAGRLDVLVNNAGMMQEASAEEMSLEAWERIMTVNLTTPFMLIKAALPHLKSTRGAIVNITSIEGIGANPRHAAYGSSKAGLQALTRAIAIDHGADGIRCNAVAPGWIDTDLNIDFIKGLSDSQNFQTRIGQIHPVGRTGRPEEVASLVAWLASEESAFVSGQTWVVDGGRTVKLSLP